jgi:hypothetical protein
LHHPIAGLNGVDNVQSIAPSLNSRLSLEIDRGPSYKLMGTQRSLCAAFSDQELFDRREKLSLV